MWRRSVNMHVSMYMRMSMSMSICHLDGSEFGLPVTLLGLELGELLLAVSE